MYVCIIVCVCMNVCMYVCMYVCTYLRTYVSMYVCMYARTCMHVCMYVYTYVSPGLAPLDPDSSSASVRGREEAKSMPLREERGAEEAGDVSAGDPLALLERRERRREAVRWGEGWGVTRESLTQTSDGSWNGSTSSPAELLLSREDCEVEAT